MKLARLPDGEPEIFHTIQGEGRQAGLPSVFVRTSLCNLYCRWCDTDYTWNWEDTGYRHDRDGEPGYTKYRRDRQITDLSPAEIAARVMAFDCRNLVLTGGEPLIQQKESLELIAELRRRADPTFAFEIETNGTLPPLPELVAVGVCFNVSPKLENSGVRLDDRRKREALNLFARLDTADFKFVTASEDDLEEILELIEFCAIPRDRVFLMPEGTTPEAIAEKADWLVDICKRQGLRYSDRWHVRLWGNRRGV